MLASLKWKTGVAVHLVGLTQDTGVQEALCHDPSEHGKGKCIDRLVAHNRHDSTICQR